MAGGSHSSCLPKAGARRASPPCRICTRTVRKSSTATRLRHRRSHYGLIVTNASAIRPSPDACTRFEPRNWRSTLSACIEKTRPLLRLYIFPYIPFFGINVAQWRRPSSRRHRRTRPRRSAQRLVDRRPHRTPPHRHRARAQAAPRCTHAALIERPNIVALERTGLAHAGSAARDHRNSRSSCGL